MKPSFVKEMSEQDKFYLRIYGERNTGTRAMYLMVEAQSAVTTCPVGVNKAYELSENNALREQIKKYYTAPWMRIYWDALRDMEHRKARPTQAWKHIAIEWDQEFADLRLHTIFAVRNPYSWFLALARNPYHYFGSKTKSLNDFLLRPWMTIARDNMPEVLEGPMCLWNCKNDSYRKFTDKALQIGLPTSTINFENFVLDPKGVMSGVFDKLGVPYEDINALNESTKEDARSLEEIVKYYKEEKWKNWLTQDLVNKLNDRIDWDVAAHYGYDRLDPDDFPERHSEDIIEEIEANIFQTGCKKNNLKKSKPRNWSRSRSLIRRLGFR